MAAAANNSKPRPAPMVVRHDQDRPSDFWRLFPAAAGSAIFHTALLLLLLFVSSLSEGSESEKENVKNDPAAEKEREKEVVKAKPQEKPKEAEDPFVAETVNPERKEFDQEIKTDADRKAEETVPELVRPDQAIGTVNGTKDAVPVDQPPALGLGNTGGSGGVGGGLDMGAGLQGIGLGEGTGGIPRGVPLAGSIFGRSGATKEMALRTGGGTGESEAAVTRGLRWLVVNQAADGHWPGCTGYDIAGTAFGLLPLLGAGHTHKPSPKNPYDKPILKGLEYLIKKQDAKGNFGNGMYAQGLATIAMCEAYGLSQDAKLRRPAQLAVDYIVWAQDDNGGGWRYGPKQAGDTSVVGWQVMALKSAQMSGLNVPEKTMRKAMEYLDNCMADNGGYGYVGKGSSATMSAVGLLCRQYLQAWGPKNAMMSKGVANHIMGKNHGIRNMYYTYYATQVMHHFGGKAWDDWNKKTRDELIATQNKTNGPDGGSWDPNQGGHAHGRIMMTSLCLLTLEVYYRHLPLYYRDSGEKK